MDIDESDRSTERTAPQPGTLRWQMEAGESADPAPRPGDTDNPGRAPDEIVPGQDEAEEPASSPDEIEPMPGDSDAPDSAPDEIPPVENLPPD